MTIIKSSEFSGALFLERHRVPLPTPFRNVKKQTFTKSTKHFNNTCSCFQYCAFEIKPSPFSVQTVFVHSV